MEKKILIIGKKSFIGSSLYRYLTKYFVVRITSFENFINYSNNLTSSFSHIINSSVHPNYIKKKYNKIYDLDRKIIDKLNNKNINYFYLNSRKIYKSKSNISENSETNPTCHYGRNKLITENYLKKKIGKKLVSLRISNVIGKRNFKNYRKRHDLFLDNFIKIKNARKKTIVENNYKDFITIEHLCGVIKNLIKKNITGIFNVSLSYKVYISEITKWLDKKNYKNLKFIASKNDSFTLSNKKLLKKIPMKINKNQLKYFCQNLDI